MTIEEILDILRIDHHFRFADYSATRNALAAAFERYKASAVEAKDEEIASLKAELAAAVEKLTPVK